MYICTLIGSLKTALPIYTCFKHFNNFFFITHCKKKYCWFNL